MPVARSSASANAADSQVYVVNKNGVDQFAYILTRLPDQVYVHYQHQDKRLDEWLLASDVRLADTQSAPRLAHAPAHPSTSGGPPRKRRRSRSRRASASASPERASRSTSADGFAEEAAAAAARENGAPAVPREEQTLGALADTGLTEEEYDLLHHKQIGAKRNFEKVFFGQWEIRTWYWSPYPLAEGEDDGGTAHALAYAPAAASAAHKIPGVVRSTIRSHGRTSDLLTGGVGRGGAGAERGTLWVCDHCFKYMTDALTWEMHVKKCGLNNPPGRKVYQRGAHIIWEVDGAAQKLYCQNLTLFGKLFIDHKTLYFDIDRFMFYVMTDADRHRDHVLGFFSKEKVSFDGYNLACIVTLPPYQRKGYGMLMIEFSYELSRRSGQLGTPERPLSDLGVKSYLSYWVATLVRFFRRLLSVLPPGVPEVISSGLLPDLAKVRSRSDSVDSVPQWKKNKAKGWYGQVPANEMTVATAPKAFEDEALFNRFRSFETRANPDGSATTRVFVRCSLNDLARATNLRPEDAAFALNECGLITKRLCVRANGAEEELDQLVVVGRETVEAVATERNVKRMCMDLSCVQI